MKHLCQSSQRWRKEWHETLALTVQILCTILNEQKFGAWLCFIWFRWGKLHLIAFFNLFNIYLRAPACQTKSEPLLTLKYTLFVKISSAKIYHFLSSFFHHKLIFGVFRRRKGHIRLIWSKPMIMRMKALKKERKRVENRPYVTKVSWKVSQFISPY